MKQSMGNSEIKTISMNRTMMSLNQRAYSHMKLQTEERIHQIRLRIVRALSQVSQRGKSGARKSRRLMSTIVREVQSQISKLIRTTYEWSFLNLHLGESILGNTSLPKSIAANSMIHRMETIWSPMKLKTITLQSI